MKTKSLILFMLLAGIILLCTNSCKKDNSSKSQKSFSIPSPQNENDLKYARLFSNFKQKGVRNLKDGEDMTIDSALFFLQGTVNFTYGDASQQTAKTVVDSTFLSLKITDGRITLTEAWNKYTEMIESIRLSYQSIEDQQKQLIAVSVESRQVTEDQLICKVTSVFSKGGIMPDFCTFNDADSWIWWNQQTTGGICNSTSPGHIGGGNGADAAELINQKIMNCLPIPIGNYYWEDPQPIILEPESYPNPNWGGSWNNKRYRMYWNHSAYPDFHGCLSPTECSYYLDGTKWVATTAQSFGGARPDDRGFISISIYGDGVWYANESKYLHHGPAYYGILHWNPNPPLPM